ncbi:MAG: tRNA preQ1(34) S-adenosylmethionine ribosyltransferase-isomerase QueA [Halobacteriovoraceae bacterium]|nr:tRNA preQ1(34) S-adenosylmethionine ribosyltransferase-isomerase QueA [Halobacteriovoraceae bacterium]|tara:strand:- start:26354 stop:27445 length:1092 start_codon:yes stop_codon:yes gene_type:complete
MSDHLLKSYHYELPSSLIAQRPCEPRDHSRLLIYNEKEDTITHEHFYNLPQFLPAGAKLVLNNSKVFPCRLIGHKPTGAKVEIFLLKKHADEKGLFPCLIKSNGKKKLGDKIIFTEDLFATIREVSLSGGYRIEFSHLSLVHTIIEEEAKIPIPPYIRSGESDERDRENYQTIYAGSQKEEEGSVAAPTAGLHFTEEVFKNLAKKNISKNFVTLHVGLGTFLPVKSEDIREHNMHSEHYFVSPNDWDEICSSEFRVAVGTTSLRVLESLWPERKEYRGGEMKETSIFLHPGVEVQSISALLTNFHLPESTLLMLVSSLIGRDKTLELYREAVAKEYRFFSYGDAMLILRDPDKVKKASLSQSQ